jgi:opacity protein-like surface antigen
MHCTLRALLGLALCGTAVNALADPLGLYAGAGAGQSTLKQDQWQVDAHVTGWKVIAGFRPVSFLGAEIEYANLGSKDVTYPANSPGVTGGGAYYQVSTSAHATSIFAVGYLPVPLPWLDLYAKAGPARIQSHTQSLYVPPSCAPHVICSVYITPEVNDSSRTSIAWGAGLQFKLGMPAVRVEYERFAGSQGNDSLLTAALTLNF